MQQQQVYKAARLAHSQQLLQPRIERHAAKHNACTLKPGSLSLSHLRRGVCSATPAQPIHPSANRNSYANDNNISSTIAGATAACPNTNTYQRLSTCLSTTTEHRSAPVSVLQLIWSAHNQAATCSQRQ